MQFLLHSCYTACDEVMNSWSFTITQGVLHFDLGGVCLLAIPSMVLLLIRELEAIIILCSIKPGYFPGGSDGRVFACNVGDLGLIPGSERYPGEGNGNPLQYSYLENSMDGGAWQAIVHGVSKSWTLLHFHFSFFL